MGLSFLCLFLLLAACGGTAGKNSQGPNLDASHVVIVLSSSDACANTPTPDASASGTDPLCDPNAAQISYSRDIAPVLAGCSGEVCHAPWDRGSLVNQPSHACCDRRLLVAPNHPSFSLLTQALTGTDSCVGTMPQDGHLSTQEIQAMTAWVCQGALDN
jgi:hypothetical protein